jgi:signal transduction histidine kinase
MVRLLLDQHSDKLHIGNPKAGRGDGKWSIHFLRRINRQDGSLAGIASLAIDPAYFINFFSSTRLGGNGFIGIVGRNGIVRARYRESTQAAEMGEELSGSELFRHLAMSEQGSYLDNGGQTDSPDMGARDGVPRIISYRSLKAYPLVIGVGIAESDALATFYQWRLWYYLGTGLFTAVTLLLTWLLIRSMTQSIRDSKELQKNELRLRDTQAMAHLGSWELDLVANRLHWSEEIFRIFEINPRPFVASYEAFLEVIHPEDRALVNKAYRESVANRTPYNVEHRLLLQDGRVKFVQEHCTSEYDDSGKPLRSCGTVQDITERRRMEENLHATEAKLGAVTANLPGMVFEMTCQDSQIFFNYASQGSQGLLGVAPEALRADPELLLRSLPAEDRIAFEESIALAAREAQMWVWEGRAIGADDKVRWMQVRALPRETYDGSILWDGVAIDITRTKQQEQALSEARHSLRELSAHHEAIREQERTRIARELHDELGQHLASLNLFLSDMEDQPGVADQSLRTEQHSRVRWLIEQAIDVTRNAVSDLRPPALDQGLGAAIAWLTGKFSRSTGIACDVDLPEQELDLDERDTTALFRILQESLTNVAKHSGATEVRIRFSMNQGALQLQVTDDGKGFNEQDVQGKRSFGLLGMRERVAMLGGNISIESTPGDGTTIKVDVMQMREAA